MKHVEECMGTVFTFDIRDDETPAIAAALRESVAFLHEVDRIFSTYKPDSDISRLARGEITVDACDPLVRQILAIGESAEREGRGAFTLTPYGSLDPSAVVKGWAIERASDILARAGATRHVVNGGGDIQAVGEPEPGEPWRVGVCDPRDRSRTFMVLGAHGRFAIATSGSAERGDHVAGADGSLLSVTVVGADLTPVDIAATTALALGATAREWIEDHPDLAAVAVTDDGRMWSSSRLAPYVLG